MSVANFDGDGYGDTSGLVYGYDDDDLDDTEIRKVIRSGYGNIGVSPGDVEPMSSTKSTLDDRLPQSPLPGDPGYAQPDCGADIPAWACEDCGNPLYIGRTCKNPSCERCWAAAVRDQVVTRAAKLYGLGGDLYHNRYDEREDVDLNHIVASLPDILVDSDEPIEHVLKILKVILEKKWHIEGFEAVYHPYRIKDEYRKDQYDHGGEPGRGDMTWADVLDKDDPYQYLKHEPHFHIFFPAKRYQFDYSTVEYVERETGWVFHRISKEDSNISVWDLDDLVHQLTYCYSHCGVIETEQKTKLASRMKGDLHNIDALDRITKQATASFCDAAPKLLGVNFTDMSEASCEAAACDCDDDEECHCEDDHPLHDLYDGDDDGTPDFNAADSSNAAPSFDETGGSDTQSALNPDSNLLSTNGTPTLEAGSPGVDDATESDTTEIAAADATRSVSPAVATDAGDTCDGDLIPMREAQSLLDDDEWCKQARYSDALRLAYEEWQDRTDDGDDDLLDQDGNAVQRR
jgi:hypothetical protein